MYVCLSSLWRWSTSLLVGFTDPYNQTYSESLWWKLFKSHKRTQIQWQRKWQRQKHRQSVSNTRHLLYFWNPDDSLIPNMIIDTSPCSSCSRWSPWLPCYSNTISSAGPSVSPFWDFFPYLCQSWHSYAGFRRFAQILGKSMLAICIFTRFLVLIFPGQRVYLCYFICFLHVGRTVQ